jgi:hypothetical protein
MNDQPGRKGRTVEPTDPKTRTVDSKPNPRIKTTDRPIREDVRQAILRDRQRALDRARKKK